MRVAQSSYSFVGQAERTGGYMLGTVGVGWGPVQTYGQMARRRRGKGGKTRGLCVDGWPGKQKRTRKERREVEDANRARQRADCVVVRLAAPPQNLNLSRTPCTHARPSISHSYPTRQDGRNFAHSRMTLLHVCDNAVERAGAAGRRGWPRALEGSSGGSFTPLSCLVGRRGGGAAANGCVVVQRSRGGCLAAEGWRLAVLEVVELMPAVLFL